MVFGVYIPQTRLRLFFATFLANKAILRLVILIFSFNFDKSESRLFYIYEYRKFDFKKGRKKDNPV